MEKEVIMRKIRSSMLYKYMFPNDELLHIQLYVCTKEKKKKASFPFNPETEK